MFPQAAQLSVLKTDKHGPSSSLKRLLLLAWCEEGRGLKKLASQPFPPLASSSQKEGTKDGSRGMKPKATSSRACQPPGRKQPRRAQKVSRDPHSDDRCHGDIQEFSRETRTGTILNRTGSLSQVSSFFLFFVFFFFMFKKLFQSVL